MMHVVYLITHKQRKENNTPPYYYVGSKWNYKGAGTYYGSSRSKIMKEATPDELTFEILHTFHDCTKTDLLNAEKQEQLDRNAVFSVEYFNMAYANSMAYAAEARLKASVLFKQKANSRDVDGVLFKVKWSNAYSKSARSRSKEHNAEIGKKHKDRLLRIDSNGETVAKNIAKKSRKTMLMVGSDGLTGDQRNALKLKETLSKVTDSGLTIAQLRGLKHREPCTIAGLEFSSKREAYKYFSLTTAISLSRLMNGVISLETYNIFTEKFGKDFADKFSIMNSEVYTRVEICGLSFYSKAEAKRKLGVSGWAMDKFTKTGEITTKLQKAVEEYKYKLAND